VNDIHCFQAEVCIGDVEEFEPMETSTADRTADPSGIQPEVSASGKLVRKFVQSTQLFNALALGVVPHTLFLSCCAVYVCCVVRVVSHLICLRKINSKIRLFKNQFKQTY